LQDELTYGDVPNSPALKTFWVSVLENWGEKKNQGKKEKKKGFHNLEQQ